MQYLYLLCAYRAKIRIQSVNKMGNALLPSRYFLPCLFGHSSESHALHASRPE